MARTKRNEILARYKEQFERAKEQYKEERGLKKAIGFNQSREAKRIKENKTKAIARYEGKKSAFIAQKIFEGESVNKFTKESFEVTASETFFWEALSYRSKSEKFTEGQELAMWREAEYSSGKKIIGFIKDFDGNLAKVTSEKQLIPQLERLYEQAEKIRSSRTKTKLIGPDGNPVRRANGRFVYITATYPRVGITYAETATEAILTIDCNEF